MKVFQITSVFFIVAALLSCNYQVDDYTEFPDCRIIYPEFGQEINKGDSVTISASFNYCCSKLLLITYYIDSIERCSFNNYPFDFIWTTDAETIGIHKIMIEVFYEDKTKCISKEIEVEILRIDNTVVADFTASPRKGEIPLWVAFTDKSTFNPTKWHWDFGDGNTDSIKKPVHVYNKEGSFSIKLIVENEYGTDSLIKTDYIVVGKDTSATFIDYRDGQIYKLVTIGNQMWFAENLNFATENSWCYNDNTSMCNIFGRLYNWESAQISCPEGWHLPTDEEWKILEGNVDSEFGLGDAMWSNAGFRGWDVGKRLKSTYGWTSDGNGNNLFGFEALAAGRRSFYGAYYRLETNANFWTSTANFSSDAWYRQLGFNRDNIGRSTETKEFGFSVRCVKD